ncbi:hypothetical protein [Escherichia coli]|uniref:hypothetical protein n=1 Tax=Escherichia coli TaxID=562 RepID=UPI001CA69DAD|nr:hypothetical protein [Escherichia coli]QZY67670.1 hypothetical protein K7X33_16380 [Escherichia coli]
MTTVNKKPRKPRTLKAEMAVKRAQELARQQIQKSLEHNIAIRDLDEEKLIQFKYDPATITTAQRQKASKEIIDLAVANLKELQLVSEESQKPVQNTKPHFQTVAKLRSVA